MIKKQQKSLFRIQLKTLIQKHYTQGIRSGQFKYELYPVLAFLIIAIYSDAIQFFWFISHYFSSFIIVVYICNYVYTAIQEKGDRVVETYKIMGMKSSSYELSWFIILYVKGILIQIIYVGLGIAAHHYLFNYGGQSIQISLYFFYNMAVTHQALLFQVFFSNPKLGLQIYSLIFIVGGFLPTFFTLEKSKYDTLNTIFTLIFPQYGLSRAESQRRLVKGYDESSQFGYDSKISLRPEDYTSILFTASIIYILLYIYLKNVIPNEYGTAKPFYYCCRCRCRNKKNVKNQNQDPENPNNEKDFSSAIYHEPFENDQHLKQTVKIKNLKKVFGHFPGFTAVDGVSLCMYEKQILCLLGHNGSGKTTSIGLLTGLLPKTAGQIDVCGYDLDYDLSEIRKIIGLCGQKDVLFNDFTIEEHLQFMCRMKGIPEDQHEHHIQEIIKKCALRAEKGKFSQNLSGGNKRKLSLAISLIGDSQIILLDEPSSGLDPNSRRVIWDILKQIQNEGKSILLTTHHLEEAEELSSRIAIMAKGKLLTVGKTDFIKKMFGIGFHLEVIMEQQKQEQNNSQQKQENVVDQNKIQQIQQIVFNIIQGAKQDPQSQPHILKFILPFQQRVNFQNLFKELEQIEKISLNLEINSLEEAFINIGMDEHKLLNKIGNSNMQSITQPQQNQNQLPHVREQRQPQIQYDQNQLQLPNQQQQQQQQNSEYSNFSNIKTPEVLSKPPTYNFFTQIKAIFQKKMYVTLRTNSVLIGILIPIAGIITVIVMMSIYGELESQELQGPPDFEKIKKVYNNESLTTQQRDYEIQQLMNENQGIEGEQEKYDYTFNLDDGIKRQDISLQLDVFSNTLQTIFIFPAAFLAVPIVQEHQNKLKYTLNVMGCKLHTYWIGTLLFDFTILLIIPLVFAIMGHVMDNLDIITKPIIEWVILLITLVFTTISLAYHLSFRYKTSSSAQRYLVFRLLFLYVWLPQLIQSFATGKDDNYTKFIVIRVTFSLISPFYAVSEAIKCLIQVEYKNDLAQKDYELAGFTMFKGKESIGEYEGAVQHFYLHVILIVISGIIYLLLAIKKDYQRSQLKETLKNNSADEDLIEQEPEVQEEQERLELLDCKDSVKVNRLSKIYPNGYQAIKNNNFGVKEGEIFGLLGPNGAGKSTTFNVITSLLPKTSGSVKLKNQEVYSSIQDVYRHVGICPQIDPIWETLTVYQHIKLFGMMKGLQGKDLQDSINYYIEVMQLTIYRNKQAGQLSGGNKRKLCVALALIGGPNMQFFDEPSSGLDPIAKRFLWNSLTQNLKLRKSAITLTTHSMLEAESLSHKIGILINGRMQCIGSPDFLKKKYGEGYILQIKLEQSKENIIRDKVLNEFPLAKKQLSDDQDQLPSELQQDKIITTGYKIPYDGFSFYKTFKYFDELMSEQLIKDFSVTQSSLEQIFLQFSKMQKSNEKGGQ